MRLRIGSVVLLVGAALAAMTGCHKEAAPPAEPPVAQAVTPPTPPTPAIKPGPPAAGVGQAEPECAAAIVTEGEAKSVKIGGRAATETGTQLAFTEPDADGQLVLGVMGPFNEDSPANLAALQKYLAFFKQEHADALVVVGDTGEVETGIAHVLGELAASNLPVLVVVGNRECRADYSTAVHEVAAKHPNLVDMNQFRSVSFPEATLLSLPGYHDANFINCAKGCRYFQSTIDELVKSAQAAKSPVVVVSHGPPLGEGSQALDYAAAAGNVGDPSLRKAIQEAGISFGLFAHIKEAGAHATDLAGTTIVEQDHPSKVLFLNPGPANTAKWKMNDGTAGHGFAATFTLQNGAARWKLLRLTAPEPTHPSPGRAPSK
jgi:Icc-related predicted phosphoesterase